jgi:MFS transporter, DHA2 family, multidrug resistance protein
MKSFEAIAAGAGADEAIQRRMITLSIMLATVIQTIDGTIANVALPHMQGSLSASQDQITWVLTSYIVAAAVATPLSGWLTDRFGVKRVFLVSISGFTVASVLCGIAGSLSQIVLARLLQGVLGAALVPLSQAVLLDINPPQKQGSAMAMWGVGVMIGPILGPALGGWLTDNWSWRWVFFINVPVGLLAFGGIWKYIRPGPAAQRTAFDLFGFATLSIAIAALQLLLDRGQGNDWFSSEESWVEAIVSVAGLTFFVVHTALTPVGRSFFNYRLLQNPNYVSGLILIFVVGVIAFSSRALIPTMLQRLMNYPTVLAGLVTAPTGVGTMIAMHMAGRLVGRVDLRVLLAAGFAATAFSLWQMIHYNLSITATDIVWPGIIQGAGMGLIFVPLSAGAFATVSRETRADATAFYSLLRNVGSAIGVTVVQTLLVRNTQIAHAGLVENLSQANPYLLGSPIAAAFDLAQPAGLVALNNEITRQAEMIAYIDDFLFLLIATLAVMPLLALIRPPVRAAALRTDSVGVE